MTYLLDTNIVIYQLNGLPAANELVDAFFEEGIAISVITYAEVLEGIGRSPEPEQARQRFAALTATMPIIDFTRREAEELIKVRLALREQGRAVRRRALDLQIAATALAHDLTLVTNDPGDYEHIPGIKLHPARITS